MSGRYLINRRLYIIGWVYRRSGYICRCDQTHVVAKKKQPPKPGETVSRVKKRPQRQLPAETSPKETILSRIDVDAVTSYTGRWVNTMTKDGIEREGKILDVADESLRIEQNFNFGSMTTDAKSREILDLLVSDS